MVAMHRGNGGPQSQEGDALLTLEAMNMFTTVTAPCDGTLQEILSAVGNTVESKDLMVRMGK